MVKTDLGTKRFDVGYEEANDLLYGQPSGNRFATLEAARFNSYDTTAYDTLMDSNYPNSTETVAIAETKTIVEEGKQKFTQPQFESYVTDFETIKVKYDTFRPKIFDENLQEVNEETLAEFKVAEVEVDTTTQRSVREQHEDDTEEKYAIKLNSKGLIVVATFVAVLVLVTVLVIINAITIGSTASRIDSLRSGNAGLNNQLRQLQDRRDDVYERRTQEIYDAIYNNPNGPTINGNPAVPL